MGKVVSIGAAFALLSGAAQAGDKTSLVDIAGPGGCVAMAGVSAGLVNHVPDQSGCAPGRGLRSVHHVTLSSDDRFIYAAAGIAGASPPNDDGALTIFKRDMKTGEFRQLPDALGCIKRIDPPRGLDGCGQARQLIGLRFVTASADNRFVYTGSFTGIAIFRRDADTGTLEQLPGKAGCVSPFQSNCTWAPRSEIVEDIAFSQDGRFAYAATVYGAVLWFRRDLETGGLELLGCAVNGAAEKPCTAGRGIKGARSVTISPDERFAYVSSISDNSLAIFHRNQVTGALEQLPAKNGCLSLTGADGCAQARGLFGPHRLTITRDGRFAYLAGKANYVGTIKHPSAVAAFRRDVQTGELAQFEGDAGCIAEPAMDGCRLGRVIKGAHAALLDSEERALYVSSDRSEGGIAVLGRDPDTGAIEQLPGEAGCLSPIQWQGCRVSRRTGGIHIMAMTKDGRFAYAASEGDYAVIGFRLEK
jgi:hypothetical protein